MDAVSAAVLGWESPGSPRPPALAVSQALEGSGASYALWAGHSSERQCRPFAGDMGTFLTPCPECANLSSGSGFVV